MSVMSNIYMDIVDMLEAGDRPLKIAAMLDIPVSTVYDVLDELEASDGYSPYDTINS